MTDTPKQALLMRIRQFQNVVQDMLRSGEEITVLHNGGEKKASAGAAVSSAPTSGLSSVKKRMGSSDSAPARPKFEMAGHEFEALAEEVENCLACSLYKTRHRTVFGEGKIDSPVVFIGEAPGADEERENRPFMGEAGELLDKILAAIGLARDQVYLCTLLKCRLPGARNPQPDEITACKSHLEKQLTLLKPKLICTLGEYAAQTLLESSVPLSRLRETDQRFRGIPLIPTLHLESLIYHPQNKRLVWEDMKRLAAKLGLKSGGAANKQ